MKALFLKSLAVITALLLIPSTGIFAQSSDKSKSLKKEFVVGQDVKLNIETSFGKVHCNVWDKNLMTIDVLVKADARSDKDAQNLLNQITPIITGNSSLVEITTKIGNTGSTGKNKSFSVDYTINMPRSTTLSVSNRFGDLFVDELTAPAKINIEYGNLTINRLSNPASDVSLKFSTGNINAMGNIKLSLEYSTLKTRNGNSINTDTRFSTIDMGDLKSLVIDSEYDSFSIGKVGTISGSGKFSNVKIDQLDEKLDMQVDYGGLDVKSVLPIFDLINVISSFNGVNIRIPSEASYRLNADMSFGECNYPKGSQVSVTEKSFTSKLITGVVGPSKSPSAKVNIKGKNCDVKLY